MAERDGAFTPGPWHFDGVCQIVEAGRPHMRVAFLPSDHAEYATRGASEMTVTRADELDARPADNAKELLAHYKRELARLINDGFSNGDSGARVVELAELNGFLDPMKERLSARQQASVNELLDALERLERQNETWEDVARALLAKYDIFEKVEG